MHHRVLNAIQDDDRSCGETKSEPCACCEGITRAVRAFRFRLADGNQAEQETHHEQVTFAAHSKARVTSWIDDAVAALVIYRDELECPDVLYAAQRAERKQRRAASAMAAAAARTQMVADPPLPRERYHPHRTRPKTPPQEIMRFVVTMRAALGPPPTASTASQFVTDPSASRSTTAPGAQSKGSHRRTRSRHSARSGAPNFSAESEPLSLSLNLRQGHGSAMLLPKSQLGSGSSHRSPTIDGLGRAFQYQMPDHVRTPPRKAHDARSRRRSLGSAVFTASADSSMTELHSDLASLDDTQHEVQLRIGSPRPQRGSARGGGRAQRFTFPVDVSALT